MFKHTRTFLAVEVCSSRNSCTCAIISLLSLLYPDPVCTALAASAPWPAHTRPPSLHAWLRREVAATFWVTWCCVFLLLREDFARLQLLKSPSSREDVAILQLKHKHSIAIETPPPRFLHPHSHPLSCTHTQTAWKGTSALWYWAAPGSFTVYILHTLLSVLNAGPALTDNWLCCVVLGDLVGLKLPLVIFRYRRLKR